MRFTDTDVAGAKVIDPTPHQDDRGRFMRAWCSKEFVEHGIKFVPLQANMGLSVRKGTVRGMHFQCTRAPKARWARIASFWAASLPLTSIVGLASA